MALILEVLHPRTGDVRARVRIAALPFTIGRALDNDCVLDDPHVDAHHARVEADGEAGVALQDLGSVNGVRAGGARVARVPLVHGTLVALGRTRLRVRDEQVAVPAAIPLDDEPAEGAARWYERPGVRLALIAGTFALVALDGWLESDSTGGANSALSLGIGMFGFASLWAGIWAVVGRVITHHARFASHLLVASLTLLVIWAAGWLEAWVLFLAPATSWWEGATGVFGLALAAAVVAAHLRYATHLSRRGRWRAAVTTAVVLVAVGLAFRLVEDDAFTSVPEFNAQLKAAPLAIVPTMPVAEVPAVLADLREAVDALAADEPSPTP